MCAQSFLQSWAGHEGNTIQHSILSALCNWIVKAKFTQYFWWTLVQCTLILFPRPTESCLAFLWFIMWQITLFIFFFDTITGFRPLIFYNMTFYISQLRFFCCLDLPILVSFPFLSQFIFWEFSFIDTMRNPSEPPALAVRCHRSVRHRYGHLISDACCIS
jgi:hypothetical protein